MHRVLPALALLALLAPMGSAQAGMTASLVAQTPGAAIAPMTETRDVQLTLTIGCPPTAAPEGITARFRIAQLPGWASATIDPTEGHVDGASCAGHEAILRSVVHLTVDPQAPAFVPALVEVRAEATGALGSRAEATTQFPMTAGFAPLLDVARPEAVLTPDPDGLAMMPLRVTNLGNANTKVVFEVEQGAPDLAVSPPSSVILVSRQQGSPTHSAQVVLGVQRREAGEAPSVFTLRYRSFYALDAGLEGQEGEMTFQVLPAPGMGEGRPLAERTVPGGAVFLVLFAAALAGSVFKNPSRDAHPP